MASHLLRTLAGRLMLAVGGPLALLVLAGATVDYLSARQLTDDAHDRALASLAVGLSARLESDRDGDLSAHLPAMVKAVGRSQPRDRLLYLVLGPRGEVVVGDPALAGLRQAHAAANPYFVDARLHDLPMRVAIHDYQGPDTTATILVAETLNGRAAEARRLLYVTVATNLAMALAAVVAALVAVRFAMRPLNALGERLEGHEVRDLRPLPLRAAPLEIVPLVRALNRLMSRVRVTAQARQAFINSTAHQLRTPLAGLSAQVDLLAGQPLPPALAPRVHEVAQSVRRLSHLAHQMLALARADAGAATRVPPRPVALPELLQEAASACLDAALARQIDLGFDPQPATVTGSHWLLRELLINLVSNAIAHTPPGSTVTARCGREAGAAFLEVEDDGPGIPPADRARVFERFVRLSDSDRHGTGLGLSIVHEIAQRHGASVQILDGPDGRGSRVHVRFDPDRPLSAV